MGGVPGIFISHTVADKPIADAWDALVKRLFSDKVAVKYSSSKELGSGVDPGAAWFNWIVDKVKTADVAFIILTPNSIQKPWVVWEAGAVAGAAYATSQSADARRVCPITYGIRPTDVPSPFAGNQIVNGTNADDIRKLSEDLLDRFDTQLDNKAKAKYGGVRDTAEREHLEAIKTILTVLPHTVTEAAVQEWLERLEGLEREGRYSEAGVIEDWMNISFGRDEEDRTRPLDVRIHRRLGQLYARNGAAEAAGRQFELARQLSPRDIYLLRQLGKAYLDGKNLDAAGKILDQIVHLDPDAFTRNQENAALKARWCQESGDVRTALQVLDVAYKKNPTSYYLGDLLGQLLLRDKQTDEAKRVYAQVLDTLKRSGEDNVWTIATGLTASLVAGFERRTGELLEDLRRVRPTREQRESILRGLTRVVDVLGSDRSILDRVQHLSDAKPVPPPVPAPEENRASG
jgi:tetratricopeptide (TPR) repeat protein